MKVISVLNYKGGCGKTATALNLAYELSKKHKVLLIDLDPQGDISSKFNDDFENVNGISEVLMKEVDINDVIYKTGVNDNLFYIPSKLDLNDTAEVLRTKSQVAILQKTLEEIKDKFDVVIIDNNPNSVTLFKNNIYAADYVIIPINIYKNSIKGIDYTIQKLNETLEDSPIDLHIDYRIVFTMVTYIKGQPTDYAKSVMKVIKDYYGDRVLDAHIRMQSKPSQMQSFNKEYFATDDLKTSYGKDYLSLSNEVEGLLNE